MRILGIEEGEEHYAKGIHNIFNKIITKNFPTLEKVLRIRVQEVSRTLNRLDQNRTSPWNIINRTTSTENRERILKADKREKTHNIHKPIKTTTDFSMQTLKARRAWREVFQALNENNFNTRIVYPATIIQNLWSNKNHP
jgi:hypothetical protein